RSVIARLSTKHPTVVRWAVAALVAVAAVTAAAILLGIPAERSAEAMVAASIKAARSAGDRSYSVRPVLPDGSSMDQPHPARLDIRDADHQVFEATSPHGERFVVGRNSDGKWAIRPDGTVGRYPSRHGGLRWIDLGEIALLTDSVDDMLAGLKA